MGVKIYGQNGSYYSTGEIFDFELFNFKQINYLEFRKQNHIDIRNRFAVLEVLSVGD